MLQVQVFGCGEQKPGLSRLSLVPAMSTQHGRNSGRTPMKFLFRFYGRYANQRSVTDPRRSTFESPGSQEHRKPAECRALAVWEPSPGPLPAGPPLAALLQPPDRQPAQLPRW